MEPRRREAARGRGPPPEADAPRLARGMAARRPRRAEAPLCEALRPRNDGRRLRPVAPVAAGNVGGDAEGTLWRSRATRRDLMVRARPASTAAEAAPEERRGVRSPVSRRALLRAALVVVGIVAVANTSFPPGYEAWGVGGRRLFRRRDGRLGNSSRSLELDRAARTQARVAPGRAPRTGRDRVRRRVLVRGGRALSRPLPDPDRRGCASFRPGRRRPRGSPRRPAQRS